jgi:hypothetical protein
VSQMNSHVLVSFFVFFGRKWGGGCEQEVHSKHRDMLNSLVCEDFQPSYLNILIRNNHFVLTGLVRNRQSTSRHHAVQNQTFSNRQQHKQQQQYNYLMTCLIYGMYGTHHVDFSLLWASSEGTILQTQDILGTGWRKSGMIFDKQV